MQNAAVLSILVKANTSSATRGLMRFNTQLGATEAKSNKALGAVKTMAKGAAIGAGIGLGYAVKKAADFEQQLDSLGSVSSASRKEMELFRKQAMKAGADTKFSALDAAQAQTELAKGGLSVKNIMGGGLKSALALAAAGEMDLGEAASTTANAMNLFALEGDKSMKVADALATAANATTADVSDFAMALSQGGSAAKAAGLSFSDTILVLEALAKIGIKNSDAGTSLKTALVQLIAPTKRQAKLADSLNMSFVNQQGKMKGVSEISAMLRSNLGKMTQAQRLATLKTLAGTDGFRTLLALYDAGPKKLDKLKAGLDKQGTAADVAAKKQDNLKGKLENLQGSIETIAISIGMKLIPGLSRAAEKITDILNDPKLTNAEKFQRLSDMLGQAVSNGLSKAADAAAKAAPKVASAFGRAFISWWYQAAPLAKIFGVAALIRVFGGKGAITAAGAAVGRLLGGGIAAGAATGAVSGAAGGAAGGAAAGGIFGAMRGKLLPLARKAGLAGVGIVLADSVISEFGRQTAARGPDLMKALEASSSPGFTSKVGNVALGPFGAKFGEGDRNKVKALKDILESTKGITAEQAKQAQNAIGLTKLDAQQQVVARKMIDVKAKAARLFGKGVSLKVGVGGLPALEKGLAGIETGFKRLKSGVDVSTTGILRVSDKNFRLISRSLGVHSLAGRLAAQRNFRLTQRSISESLHMGWISADKAMKAIQHSFAVNSKGSKATATKNFGLARSAIQSAVDAGRISADRGLKEINRLFRTYLAEFGIKGNDADLYLKTPGRNRGTPGVGMQGDNAGGHRVQRGGRIFGGAPSGDSIPAVLERGEYVLNRRAVQAIGPRQLDAVNFSAAPRFAKGGEVPRQRVGGPGFGGIQPGVQRGLDANVDAANKKLREAKAKYEAAQAPAGGGAPTGVKGVVSYPGLPMGIAAWVKGALDHARKKGVAPQPTSGYRSHAYNVAQGRTYFSEHEGTQYPHGAVDYGGFTTGLGAKMAVVAATRDYKYPLLAPIGFRDDGHASGTGHQRGGIIGMRSGGLLSGLNKRFPAHYLGQSGTALSSAQVRAVAEHWGRLSPRSAVIADKITERESTRRPGIIGRDPGGTLGIGLWQITRGVQGALGKSWIDKRGGDAGMRNPKKNAQVMSIMSGRGARWGDWAASGGTPTAPANVRSVFRGGATGAGPSEAASPMSKRNRKILKRIPKRLKKIKGIGLSKKQEGWLKFLTNSGANFGEWGSRAGQLSSDDAQGKVGGQNEAFWTKRQLESLFALRNTLIRYEQLIVKKRERMKKMIDRAKKFLRKLERHPKRNRPLIKAYKSKLIPAMKKRRSGLNTRRGELLSSLEEVQGIASPMGVMGKLPPIGTLGGQIFAAQTRLRELGTKTSDISDSSPAAVDTESADLLRQLLQQSRMRELVGQNEIANLPFAGSFVKGGIVPGRGPMAAVVHGGEAIGQPGAVSVQVFVHPGGQGADVYVNEKKVEAVVEKVTRNMARKVGRAPGARG